MTKRITATDDKKHHKYGGSTSKRWLTCTAAMCQVDADREAGIIPKHQESSFAAEEGTRAHNLAEVCLIKGYEPEDFYMQEFEGATIDENYINAVNVYVNYCNSLRNKPNVHWSGVEDSFELSHLVGADCGGSADFSIAYGKTLEVVDYKHGQGIVVDVEGNTQARLYALGLFRLLEKEQPKIAKKIKTVKLVIVQPRIAHVDGPIRIEEITVDELIRFQKKCKRAIRKGESGRGVFVAGDHCTFCPRAGHCQTNASHSMELAEIDFSNIDDELPVVNQLTKDEVELILVNASKIKNWLDSVKMYATKAADSGETFNKHKLVERYGHRKFSNKEQRIVRKLKKAGYDTTLIYEQKLRSPAQLEVAIAAVSSKKEAKEFVDGITLKPILGVALVPNTDGRETVKTTAETDFVEYQTKK